MPPALKKIPGRHGLIRSNNRIRFAAPQGENRSGEIAGFHIQGVTIEMGVTTINNNCAPRL